MQQEVTIPAVQDKTIAAPDLSMIREHLTKVSFAPMLEWHVADDTSAAIARDNGRAAQDFIDVVDSALGATKKSAHAVWKFFTSLEADLTNIPKAVVAHCKREIGEFDLAKDRAREELVRKLQLEAEARVRAEAEAERAAKLAEAMPWEVETISTVPIVVTAPSVYIAPSVPTAGVRATNKPWDYEVADKKAFVKFVAENCDKRPDLLEYVELNDKLMTIKVRQVQAAIKDLFPGIVGVRGKRIGL